jgi:hypothetical protein
MKRRRIEIAATLPITAPAMSGVAGGVLLFCSAFDFGFAVLVFAGALGPGPPMNPGTKVGSPGLIDREDELSVWDGVDDVTRVVDVPGRGVCGDGAVKTMSVLYPLAY